MDILRLIENAYNAKKNSYAPYSRFHVGAALLPSGNDGILQRRGVSGCACEKQNRVQNIYFGRIAAGGFFETEPFIKIF